MLTAIRKSDNKKVIGDFIEKDTKAEYYCEKCKGIVIHNKSESRIKCGHFKHKVQCNCVDSGETIEHLQSKLNIYNYIKTNWGNKLELIEIEKWICNKSIRPDIYIETNRTKIAIEVQASVLPVMEIKRRTEKYYKENIFVLWMLLFDFSRFYVTESRGSWKGYSWFDGKQEYFLAEKIRLSEFEIFIYRSYYNKLIMWDLSSEYSEGFIVVELDDYKTESVEFYRDGEEFSFSGKTRITMKSPQRIIMDIPFDKFRPINANRFEGNKRDYDISERTIFTYDKKLINNKQKHRR